MGVVLACLALIAVAGTVGFCGLIAWDRLNERKTPPDGATTEGYEWKTS